MGNDDLLTDDYVAGLLTKEANDCSIKYSALGMEAFRVDKKPTNMPKPNTRFLRHIIKNTDSHNKALLAKEAAESKARLGDLETAAEVKRQRLNPDSNTIRKRQMGDIHAILGGKRRSDRSEGRSERKRERDGERPSSGADRRERERSGRHKKDLFDERDSDDKHRGRLSRHSEDSERSRRHGQRRRDGASDNDRKASSRRQSHKSRSRSRSRSPRHTSNTRETGRSRRHRSPVASRNSPPRPSKALLEQRDEDSDPLEEFIGPAHAPTYRGRGTLASSSGIDRRFSDSYNPKLDVDMDEVVGGETNWDDAVEAFRDRQKLKQAQEERLRAAGFGHDEINKTNSNFKWSGPGEKREWDVGKEVEKQSSGLFREFSEDED